jgi:hypothetical protein
MLWKLLQFPSFFDGNCPKKGAVTLQFFRNFSAEIVFSAKSLFFSTIFTLHFLAILLHFTNKNTKAQNSNYKI